MTKVTIFIVFLVLDHENAGRMQHASGAIAFDGLSFVDTDDNIIEL